MNNEQSGSGVRQHHNYAQGKTIDGQGSAGSAFGVGKLGEGCRVCSDVGGSTLKDGGRSATGPIARGAGMMGATANSDHGPH